MKPVRTCLAAAALVAFAACTKKTETPPLPKTATATIALVASLSEAPADHRDMARPGDAAVVPSARGT